MESKVNCLLDWFKFSINKRFDRFDSSLSHLFSAMKLDIDVFDDNGPTTQYGQRLMYDQNTVVLAYPRSDKNVARIGVADYFFVDMSGDACRDFEMRGGSWKELFEAIASFSYHCTRIDVSIDDFGIMNLGELQDKIDRHEYVSCFRGTAKDSYHILPDNVDDFDDVFIRRKAYTKTRRSWSATFGTKQTVELQFYDKLMERFSKGVDVDVPQWIRTEMRFREKKADPCFVECLSALRNGSFSNFAMSLLLGLIDFKGYKDDFRSTSSFDMTRISDYPRWEQFQSLVGNVDALKIESPKGNIDEDYMLSHMEDWVSVAAANTLSMIMASDPVMFMDKVQDMVADYVSDSKFKNRQVAIVNAWRKKHSLPILTYDEVMAFFKDNLGVVPVSRYKKKD